jgi:hypothetical protein
MQRSSASSAPHVLGHDDVTINKEMIATTNSLQRRFEGTLPFFIHEKRLSLVAGEGNEVRLSGVMVALERPGYSTG